MRFSTKQFLLCRCYPLLIVLLLSTLTACFGQDYFVYIASNSNDADVGIPVLRLDGHSGTLTHVSSDATSPSTGYVTIHPNGRNLYSIDGQFIYSFKIDPTSGELDLKGKEKIVGKGPCHVSVGPQGRFAFVANYGGGEVLVYPLTADGGLAGPPKLTKHNTASNADPKRQTAAHPHMALPVAERLLVPDLGADITYVYDVSHDGSLTLVAEGGSPAAGGPRHFCFHPNGEYGYILNELAGSVTSFAYDSKVGSLKSIQTISTLPKGNTITNKSADIHITPNGQYLYASNRGPNTIAVFAVDDNNGRLDKKGEFSVEGDWPRAFGISPDGKYLVAANKNSNNIVVFAIDYSNGLVKKISELSVPGPQGVKFLATD